MNRLSLTPVTRPFARFVASCDSRGLAGRIGTTRFACIALVFFLTAFGFVPRHSASAAPDGRAVLPGHLALQAVKHLTATGALDPKRDLMLDLVLPLRNQADLDDLTRRLYDPADPLYGQYLTPAQFAERFGPSLSDVSAVAAFAKSEGLTVKSISQNRAVVQVHGPVSAIETAFGVTMQGYAGRDGSDFYGPDAEPTIPASLTGKLLAVVGLNNLGKPRAFSHRVHPRPASSSALPNDARPVGQANYSGNAGLSPFDILSIYNFASNSYTGAGQTLGLYELGTYTASDITEYETYYGITPPVFDNVGVDGFDTGSAPNGASGEVTLDIDMFLALSHTISKIVVYEAGDDGSTTAFETASLDIFNKAATDDIVSVLSVSYGISEIDVTQAEAQANNQALTQLEMQGQTVCVAAGDAGAYTDQSNAPNDSPNTSEPASQPLVLAVGGTDLEDSTTYPFSYVAETSWADTGDVGRGNNGTGGGGGVSQYWTLPSYQSSSFNTTVNPQGSTMFRNVPDVSLYGDYDDGGYDVYFTDPTNGPGWYGENGTSAACPLWAAFLVDVNQARLAASPAKPKIGLANPAIYALAEQPSKYAADFHDIKDGSNNLFYNAVTGYDNSTGWGSFNGDNLFNDLVGSGTGTSVTVTSLSFNPNPVVTGGVSVGTITLSGNAPSGGAAVVISTNGTTIGTVTVAAGSATKTFNLTNNVSPGSYTEKATYSGSSASVTLVVTAAASAPTITSFSPTSGAVGASVIITGTNFTGVTAVKFNGVASTTFAANSGTQIQAIVPTGATTGTVTVTTSAGTGQSTTSFTVTTTVSAPTVTSFSPASGPVGTVITVTGTNLNGVTAVRFHSANATVFSANAQGTQLTVTVPSGALTGTLTITTSGGSVQTATQFTVTTTGSGPMVTSFSPTSGSPGTVVTVTGAGFTGVTQVTLNGLSVGYSFVSDTSLTFTVPSGATTGKIGVTTSAGTGQSTANFTVQSVTPGPAVTSFSPTSGSPGTVVTVTGSGFTGVTKVTLNGLSVGYSFVSDTSLTFTVPSGATSGTIGVTTSAGTGQSTASFTVATTGTGPTVTSFSPASGSPGTVVTVTGSGFTGVTKVTLNGLSVGYSFVSDTSLTFTVPSGATTGKIGVTTSAGTGQSPASFTVQSAVSAPTITGISPTSGSAGTTITITGMGLGGVTQVTVDGVAVAFTVVNSTTITFVVPAGLSSGTVTVTSPGGSATSSAIFTVSTWSAADVSSAADGTARMLWRRSDGAAGLWSLNASDIQTHVGPTYGPYSDSGGFWTAQTVSTAADGTSRMLWTRSDGAMGVWNLDANDTVTNTGVVYGPYAGWKAVDVAAASDGTVRLLWVYKDGTSGVWKLDATGKQTVVGPTYGPYAGWAAIAVGVAGDGTSRLLWSNTNGEAGVWSLDASGNQTLVGPTYGPYSGWKVADLGTSSNGTSNVLWKHNDGSAGAWTFNTQDVGVTVGTTYGPYTTPQGSWSAIGLDAAGGLSRILWDRSDRVAGVWTLSASGVQITVGTTYGPY